MTIEDSRSRPSGLIAATTAMTSVATAETRIAIRGTPVRGLTAPSRAGSCPSRAIPYMRRLTAACATSAESTGPIARAVVTVVPSHAPIWSLIVV